MSATLPCMSKHPTDVQHICRMPLGHEGPHVCSYCNVTWADTRPEPALAAKVTVTHMFEITASTKGDSHGWKNLTQHIATTSVERAIEIFRDVYPDATLHKVERRMNTGKNGVLVDERLVT